AGRRVLATTTANPLGPGTFGDTVTLTTRSSSWPLRLAGATVDAVDAVSRGGGVSASRATASRSTTPTPASTATSRAVSGRPSPLILLAHGSRRSCSRVALTRPTASSPASSAVLTSSARPYEVVTSSSTVPTWRPAPYSPVTTTTATLPAMSRAN